MTGPELRPEILAAAQWMQEQLDREPFADAGILIAQHDGSIRRTDYTLTVKRKSTATAAGARHERRR